MIFSNSIAFSDLDETIFDRDSKVRELTSDLGSLYGVNGEIAQLVPNTAKNPGLFLEDIPFSQRQLFVPQTEFQEALLRHNTHVAVMLAHGAAILENGTKITNLAGEVLSRKDFTPEELLNINDILEQHPDLYTKLLVEGTSNNGERIVHFFINCDRNEFNSLKTQRELKGKNPNILKRITKAPVEFDERDVSSIVQTILESQTGTFMINCKEGQEQTLADLFVAGGMSVTLQEGLINIQTQGTTKGTTTAGVMHNLPADISFFVQGDGSNDLPLITVAGSLPKEISDRIHPVFVGKKARAAQLYRLNRRYPFINKLSPNTLYIPEPSQLVAALKNYLLSNKT